MIPLRLCQADAMTDPTDRAPLVADAAALAKLLDCGLRTVHTLNTSGKLPVPIRIGGRVVWRVDEIRDWLAAGAPPREEWEARRAALRK